MEFYKPTLAEVLDGRDLTDAEERLLSCCKTGELAVFGDTVPDDPNPNNQIDAALIRFLLLGGDVDNPLHPKGVQIVGAYISGRLDFECCSTDLTLICAFCRFESELNFMDAKLGQLNLHGSHLPSLNGHRMAVARDVLLRGGFKANGLVDLTSATIGRQLACEGGSFDGGEVDGVLQTALLCNAIQVGGSVILRDGFTARGLVSFLRATIGGQLACSGGSFEGGKDKDGNLQTALMCDAIQVGADVFLRDGFTALGEVSFIRADVTGHLDCNGAKLDGVFNAETARIGQAFNWQGITGQQSTVSLIDADVGVLRDDVDSWDGVELLGLKGFTYGALDNQVSDFPLQDRLKWVGRSFCLNYDQTKSNKAGYFVGGDTKRFQPQPYVQLAKAYETAGQRGHAARVREEMERRLRRSSYVAAHLGQAGSHYLEEKRLFAPIKAGFDAIFGTVFGYGHAPMRGVLFALMVVLMTSFFYGLVYSKGQFAPNSDIILTSQDWRNYADDDAVANPADVWSKSKAGQDYESFDAIGYGFDLFLPLDALGQEEAWAPSKDRGPWGAWGFYMRWVIQTLGWIFTAVLAAALTGIIGRKDP